jgi:hypothetical protein
VQQHQRSKHAAASQPPSTIFSLTFLMNAFFICAFFLKQFGLDFELGFGFPAVRKIWSEFE